MKRKGKKKKRERKTEKRVKREVKKLGGKGVYFLSVGFGSHGKISKTFLREKKFHNYSVMFSPFQMLF